MYFLGKSALRILPIVITPVSRCVYVREYVYPFALTHVASELKLRKSHSYELGHFQSNRANPVFLVLDLDFHFHIIWLQCSHINV